MTTSLILGLTSLISSGYTGPSRPDCLAPTVEFKLPAHVVAGEPIFLQCTLTNPNDAPITIGFTPHINAWITATIEKPGPRDLIASAAPSKTRSSPEIVQPDRMYSGDTFTARPRQMYDEVHLVGIEKAGAGPVEVHVHGLITFKSGTVSEATLIGGAPVDIDERIALIVDEPSPAGLQAAALRIGAVLAKNDGPICPGFDPHLAAGDLATAFDAWLAMPAVCAPSWRATLLDGANAACLTRACRILAKRTEPEIAELLTQIVTYADSLEVKFGDALRETIRKSKSETKGHGD